MQIKLIINYSMYLRSCCLMSQEKNSMTSQFQTVSELMTYLKDNEVFITIHPCCLVA